MTVRWTVVEGLSQAPTFSGVPHHGREELRAWTGFAGPKLVDLAAVDDEAFRSPVPNSRQVFTTVSNISRQLFHRHS